MPATRESSTRIDSQQPIGAVVAIPGRKDPWPVSLQHRPSVPYSRPIREAPLGGPTTASSFLPLEQLDSCPGMDPRARISPGSSPAGSPPATYSSGRSAPSACRLGPRQNYAHYDAERRDGGSRQGYRGVAEMRSYQRGRM